MSVHGNNDRWLVGQHSAQRLVPELVHVDRVDSVYGALLSYFHPGTLQCLTCSCLTTEAKQTQFTSSTSGSDGSDVILMFFYIESNR